MTKNNFFRIAMALCLMMLMMISNGYSQKREAPKDWKEIKICGISFLIPKEMKDKKARGIDSCVASFASKKIRLEMDYGSYTAAPEDSTDYQKSKTEIMEIDGKKATLSTFWNKSEIYIPVTESENVKTALGMTINGKNETTLEIARQIFQSIRFIDMK